MRNAIHATVKVATFPRFAYLLPALLTSNTLVLFALEQTGSIPSWIKTAAALFLSF